MRLLLLKIIIVQSPQQPVPEPEPILEPGPVLQPRFTLNSLYPTMNNKELPKVEVVTRKSATSTTRDLKEINEDKQIETDEIKSPRKEMVLLKMKMI